MFQVISENPLPKVNQVCMRFYATSDVEANEIFAQTPDNTIVSVGANRMPYTEEQDDLSEDIQANDGCGIERGS